MKKMCMIASLALSLFFGNSFAEEKESCMAAFTNNDVLQGLVMKLATGSYHIGARKPKMYDVTEWSATCGWVSELSKEKDLAKEWEASLKLTTEVDSYLHGLAYYILTGKLTNDDDIVFCKINRKLQKDLAFDHVPASGWQGSGLSGQPKLVPMSKKTCVKYESTFEPFE